jgi:hypothetical protein
MAELPLDIRDHVTAIGLIPAPVKAFGREAELDDEVAGKIFWFDFGTLFLPKAKQGGLVIAKDDPGV